jgi:hypothetical protein
VIAPAEQPCLLPHARFARLSQAPPAPIQRERERKRERERARELEGNAFRYIQDLMFGWFRVQGFLLSCNDTLNPKLNPIH